MSYPGSCCVCAFTLCLCIFGSMTTSTGVSLLMDYDLFGRNSSTPRAFPPGAWNKSVGIALSSAGSVMFLTGVILALCCLTAGVSVKDKLGVKSKRYELFQNEEAATDSVTPSPNTEGNDKKQLSEEYAYDVTFEDDDVFKAVPPDNSIPRQGPVIISGHSLECTKTIRSILKSISIPDDRGVHGECRPIDDPHIYYPSVVIEDSHTVDDLPNLEDHLHSLTT